MDNLNSHLIGVAVPTLRQLRSAVLASADPDSSVAALRDAGYAGGESIHSAFEQWLAESTAADNADAGDLLLSEFGEKAAEFFRNAGWGNVQFSHQEDDAVAIVDITDCWEGVGAESDEDPG